MDDIKILDAVEKYIQGEMNPDERLYFENLRKTNPEIDQLVVEHTLFLQQMNRFGEWKKFKSALHDTHIHLAEQGKINSAKLTGKAKVVYLWKRYRRVAAIAASIAGITAITISVLVWSLSPKTTPAEFEMMDKAIGSLGEPCKSLLEAYYLQKQNMQVIAVNFGYTNADNAKNQKYKCLMRLKKIFFTHYKNGNSDG